MQHAAVWRGPARLSARARLARGVLIAMLRIPLNAGTAPEQLFNLLRASIKAILSGCFLGEIGGIAAIENSLTHKRMRCSKSEFTRQYV